MSAHEQSRPCKANYLWRRDAFAVVWLWAITGGDPENLVDGPHHPRDILWDHMRRVIQAWSSNAPPGMSIPNARKRFGESARPTKSTASPGKDEFRKSIEKFYLEEPLDQPRREPGLLEIWIEGLYWPVVRKAETTGVLENALHALFENKDALHRLLEWKDGVLMKCLGPLPEAVPADGGHLDQEMSFDFDSAKLELLDAFLRTHRHEAPPPGPEADNWAVRRLEAVCHWLPDDRWWRAEHPAVAGPRRRIVISDAVHTGVGKTTLLQASVWQSLCDRRRSQYIDLADATAPFPAPSDDVELVAIDTLEAAGENADAVLRWWSDQQSSTVEILAACRIKDEAADELVDAIRRSDWRRVVCGRVDAVAIVQELIENLPTPKHKEIARALGPSATPLIITVISGLPTDDLQRGTEIGVAATVQLWTRFLDQRTRRLLRLERRGSLSREGIEKRKGLLRLHSLAAALALCQGSGGRLGWSAWSRACREYGFTAESAMADLSACGLGSVVSDGPQLASRSIQLGHDEIVHSSAAMWLSDHATSLAAGEISSQAQEFAAKLLEKEDYDVARVVAMAGCLTSGDPSGLEKLQTCLDGSAVARAWSVLVGVGWREHFAWLHKEASAETPTPWRFWREAPVWTKAPQVQAIWETRWESAPASTLLAVSLKGLCPPPESTFFELLARPDDLSVRRVAASAFSRSTNFPIGAAVRTILDQQRVAPSGFRDKDGLPSADVFDPDHAMAKDAAVDRATEVFREWILPKPRRGFRTSQGSHRTYWLNPFARRSKRAVEHYERGGNQQAIEELDGLFAAHGLYQLEEAVWALTVAHSGVEWSGMVLDSAIRGLASAPFRLGRALAGWVTGIARNDLDKATQTLLQKMGEMEAVLEKQAVWRLTADAGLVLVRRGAITQARHFFVQLSQLGCAPEPEQVHNRWNLTWVADVLASSLLWGSDEAESPGEAIVRVRGLLPASFLGALPLMAVGQKRGFQWDLAAIVDGLWERVRVPGGAPSRDVLVFVASAIEDGVEPGFDTLWALRQTLQETSATFPLIDRHHQQVLTSFVEEWWEQAERVEEFREYQYYMDNPPDEWSPRGPMLSATDWSTALGELTQSVDLSVDEDRRSVLVELVGLLPLDGVRELLGMRISRLRLLEEH